MTKISEKMKGHVRITIDVEVNEPLMDALKESMQNMPHMVKELIPSGKNNK
ncbi:MAG: hypothetical protein QCH99_08330 [Candidatus Bathyarchaeota archaeon]|nr:hypothetical protein [Candidatus Bathyarchaeum tardum]